MSQFLRRLRYVYSRVVYYYLYPWCTTCGVYRAGVLGKGSWRVGENMPSWPAGRLFYNKECLPCLRERAAREVSPLTEPVK